MDPKITEDTTPVHWKLNPTQTTNFLAKLFPDDRLFPSGGVTPPSIKSILLQMDNLRQRRNGRWTYCPDMFENLDDAEEKVAQFFNRVVQHVPDSYLCTRRWTGKASDNPMNGLGGAIRKPDLLLCEEGVITNRDAKKEKFDMRTDVYVIGEVKKTYNDEHKKTSYTELAGKAAFLLEAQDGRYATPGIRFLGSHIILTLFDRGGSISTHPLDIHDFPEEFLRIILGVTFADAIALGFDSTILPTADQQKQIQISVRQKEHSVIVDTLLFFSGSLHSRGTTVWSGKVTLDEAEEEVVVKDSWVDPLRHYTEGRILRMLEKAKVKRVPKLVHEQQVRTQHPITRDLLNHSTHILRLLIDGCPRSSYNLRVLSRLVSKPRGYPIFDFTSLSELRVGLADCLCAHRDALKDAGILHRDISLLNLFLVLVHDELGTEFINRVLQEPERTRMRARIESLSHRGLLGDWGYAVPINVSPRDELASESELSTPLVHVEESKPLSPTHLKTTHSIVIPVADEPLPQDSGLSIDSSSLQRTGTWAWMATELNHVGPGKPVVHKGHHDLESFFYVLLSICLLYDEPGKCKPPKVLEVCFDPFFAVAYPSTLKTTTIQSNFGWTGLILPHISQYFRPLIPLLEVIRKKLILPIKIRGNKMKANRRFTHDDFIDEIVVVLSKLPKKYWIEMGSKSKPGNTVPQNITGTSSSAISGSSSPAVAPSTILPNNPIQRLAPIRLKSTSSAGVKRRREYEDEGNSRTAKRRTTVEETTDSGNPSSTDTSDGGLSDTSWVETSSPSESDPAPSV